MVSLSCSSWCADDSASSLMSVSFMSFSCSCCCSSNTDSSWLAGLRTNLQRAVLSQSHLLQSTSLSTTGARKCVANSTTITDGKNETYFCKSWKDYLCSALYISKCTLWVKKTCHSQCSFHTRTSTNNICKHKHNQLPVHLTWHQIVSIWLVLLGRCERRRAGPGRTEPVTHPSTDSLYQSQHLTSSAASASCGKTLWWMESLAE